ncbi:MAG: Gfo/Idh/MocA family oxidoreductase [Candidatus Hydrogenedentes bacterium]|nr:Gfo/Idh/MocA family oxidoreductase [Candidatus Hydrogenedentota bacterium]
MAAAAGPAIAQPGSANEKLGVAIVGIGGQGEFSYENLRRERMVAVADVDTVRAGKPYTAFDASCQFTDYRKMFDKMHASIDAVVVATPDHSHFHPASIALELGKHVYLEKPMAHNVWEIRKLTELAAQKGLTTQLGMQRHVKDNMHRVTELIQAGAIGDVTEVHTWIGSERGMFPRLTEPQIVPATLDYDLWLGPVEHRPYDSKITPYGWRFWWDFGTGETGNWGCHDLDIPFSALHLDYPTHVAVTGPEPHAEMTPTAMHSIFDFPAKGDRKALKLHWYQANGGPEILKHYGLSTKGKNNLFIGTKGILLCGFDERDLMQQDAKGTWVSVLTHKSAMDFAVPEKSVPDSPGFHQEFVNACKGGATPPTCNFSYSGPLSETVILANVAYRSKEAFDWDHTTMTCANAPAAQALIKPVYKAGWEVA